MQIEKSSVEKILIRPDNGQPICVFVESFGPCVARMTLVCDGDAWSYAWGAMGKQTPTLDTFIAQCHPQYVTQKLAPQLPDTEIDLSCLVEESRKHIVERRREDEYDRSMARELYDRCYELDDGVEGNEMLLYEIYGDEWWYCLPDKPDPEYVRLYKIVQNVIEAFKEMTRPVETAV